MCAKLNLFKPNLIKKNHTILISGGSFILGCGAGWIVQGKFWNVFFTSYVPSLATLIAAYFGAKYAFDFQHKKELEEKKKKQIVNGNLVIFNVIRLINNLLNYQQQVIDPVRNKASVFLEMEPTIQIEKDDVKIDLNSIFDILDIEDVNLLGEISIGISRYYKVIDAINDRSIIHINEIQPALERAGMVQEGNYLLEQIEEALGNRLFVTINQATQQVIDHVDDTLITLQEICEKFTAILTKQFPGEKILTISLPNESNNNI